MTKQFLRIISKMKFLFPLYLIVFHCSLPVDPAEFAPQNLKYDKEQFFISVGDELKAEASVEYAVDSCTIDPALPAGLNLDKLTGTISGKCDSILPQTTFTIHAFNKNGSTACIIKLEILPIPKVIIQPQNVSAKINGSVTLTAKATGKSPLKYSWLKGNVTLTGKDSSSLTITSVSFPDTGYYYCEVVDLAGKTVRSDPAHFQITDSGVVTKTDTIPPVITRVMPAKDSAITNATNYTIKVSCTDSSGVAAVNGTLGTQSFTGTKGTGDNWTIQVSGLVVNTINKVIVTATDSSVNAKSSTANYYIKCDPTMIDIEPPTVYFTNPVKDTVVSVDSFFVTVVCKDPSGITSLTGLLDITPFTMSKSATADSIWTGTVKGLPSGAYATIKLTATDASAAQNKDSTSVRIKYDNKDDNDITGPVMTRITPAKDSVSTNATSYTIKISCTDLSGVATVKGTLSSLSFTGTKGTGNEWIVEISGLTVNAINAIKITATDSSPKVNTSTLDYYVKCDPTISDNDPPRVYFTSPIKDTVVGVDSFFITAICKDPSGITSLTGLLDITPFTMSKSATADSIWTGTVKGLPSGAYATVKLVAIDASTAKNKDSVSVRIKYDGDIAGPVITRVNPAKDSASTNETSYIIKITCTDQISGVTSVKGTLGSQSFTGTRGTGNDWTIAVSGLAVNVFNTVVITATDSSLKANTSTLNYYVKCDPTMGDNIPPTVYFTSPVKDTVVGVDSFAITAVCKDPSSITSLTGMINLTPFVMSKSSTADSIWTGTVKGIPSGAYATIKLIATDASTAKNKDSVSVRIKYDSDISGPVMTKSTPAKDSVSTNATNYTIMISCTDSSGVASVKGSLGSQSFTGTKGSGNDWTIAVTGLTANVFNTVAITAKDSSLKANVSTLNFYIKCDPTMLDSIGPTIVQKSGPTPGAIVTNAVVDIIDSISDPSRIDNVYWTRNGGTKKTMSPVTGSADQYSLKDTLTEGKFDTLLVTAIDKSTRSNPSTQTIILKYIKAPAITVQPASQAVCAGSPATFTVTATGTAPLTYQWRSGATNIPNATNSAYTPSTTSGGQTILSCVVSNGASTSATSSLCTLTVNQAPTITGPTNQTTCAGTNATLSVSASGATGFQWYLGTSPNGSIRSGATSASYSTSTAGSYYCVVTGSGCSATSNAATVTVNTPPTITGPTNQTTCAGTNATLSVSASGATGFQWYLGTSPNGSIRSGATSASYSTSTAGSYYCVVTKAGCSTTSDAATVTISQAPNVTISGGGTFCSGTSTVLSVSGSNISQFQWYNQSGIISGAISSVYSTSTTGTYHCSYRTSDGCTFNSPSATVTINTIAVGSLQSVISACSNQQVLLPIAATCQVSTYEWFMDNGGGPHPIVIDDMFYKMSDDGTLNIPYYTDGIFTGYYYCTVTDFYGHTATTNSCHIIAKTSGCP